MTHAQQDQIVTQWAPPTERGGTREFPRWATVLFGVLASLVLADCASKTLSHGPALFLSALLPFAVVAAAAVWLGGRGLGESGFVYCALWGGLVAISVAGVLNSVTDWLASYFVEPVEGMTWPAVVLAAPIFEEFFKTQPLSKVIRRDTKMVHTAVSYVWASAAGFAFVENIGYFAGSLEGVLRHRVRGDGSATIWALDVCARRFLDTRCYRLGA